MTKDQTTSENEVSIGRQSRIYKKGKKPPRGIDPKSFTPEFVRELTQGTKAERDIAGLRWLNTLPDEE